MSKKLTRRVKGYFRHRKKDQCYQGVKLVEETALTEVKISSGPIPGDEKI